MRYFTHLVSLALLAVTVHGDTVANVSYVPPSKKGVPGATSVAAVNVTTDTQAIVDTASVVNQKAGPAAHAPPNLPVANTTVTAVDGQVVTNGTSIAGLTSRDLSVEKRTVTGYTKVFDGTGANKSANHDGAVEGTAYLTYTLVNNATYNVDDCLTFCNTVDGCVFVNLYYEFNNPLLDWVFSERSNLKCAAYGDIHTAAEKTNRGGQQLEPLPAGLSYIQQSSGWAADSIGNPPDPSGYQLVFGPTNGANNAPGYMGFAFIDKYDVNACAALCNTRGADRAGGACQYFNIWRAVVNGVPTTYTCAFYYLVADPSTAVNYGQGNLQVTFSRGYKRLSLAIDGGFEDYTCGGDTFCYTDVTYSWVGSSPLDGSLDASVFHYYPYARTGSSVALLGSATGWDTFSGTLSPKKRLNTVAGKRYSITFFANTLYAGSDAERSAQVSVLWNGKSVRTINLGYADWTYYETTVTAVGKDTFALYGGSAPAWIFIDDVYLWAL